MPSVYTMKKAKMFWGSFVTVGTARLANKESILNSDIFADSTTSYNQKRRS